MEQKFKESESGGEGRGGTEREGREKDAVIMRASKGRKEKREVGEGGRWGRKEGGGGTMLVTSKAGKLGAYIAIASSSSSSSECALVDLKAGEPHRHLGDDAEPHRC